MTMKSAIQAMLKGKKVRDTKWEKNKFIYFSDEDFRTEGNLVFNSFHMGHDDWEIYEEPKPKQVVIIEKWLCKSALDNYFIIEGEKAFFKTGGYDKQQVKLLDTYKVEI